MMEWLQSRLTAPDRNDGNGSGDDRGDEFDIVGLTDAETRSELCHEVYIDSTNLVDALADCSPTRSLEVGCGYGRLTPWVADRADEHYAIDPARPLLLAARDEYPDVEFQRARAEALPFPDDVFDIAVTWGVLNHIPSDSIRAATDELDRVVTPDGTLVVSEATDGRPDPRWKYRSLEEWCALFPSRQLDWHTYTERDEEPFRNPEREHAVMKFR